MKNKNLLNIVISILVMISSCNQNLISSNVNDTINSYDTIRSMDSTNSSEGCNKSKDSYYNRFGIVISDYFILIDSLVIDLNHDNISDMIIILSPICLESLHIQCICNFNVDYRRLLVEIINDSDHPKIRGIYSSMISNIGGVLSPYNGIYITKNGFEIVHQAGAKYSWKYITEYSTSNPNQLSLFRISKSCSFEGKNKDLELYFNKESVNKIDILDTLQLNCNCDKYWLELEKK